jgi:hypothetical protein
MLFRTLSAELDLPQQNTSALKKEESLRLIWEENLWDRSWGLPWELVEARLLSQQPGSGWGEGLWCFNPTCNNVSGAGD